MKVYLQILQLNLLVSCFITSLVYKRKLLKMELSLSHTLHLFNIFHKYDGKENCAQMLEEEIYKMFGTKYVNDEHDCNVVSTNSLNIHDTNDDCTSYDVSYKHVNFCGVRWVCKYTPNRDNRYCKRHKYLETKLSTKVR